MKHALDRYFEDTGDNASRLAERIGRSASSVTRPLRGERNASMDLARDIERGTNGKVSAAEFITICLEAQKSRASIAEAVSA